MTPESRAKEGIGSVGTFPSKGNSMCKGPGTCLAQCEEQQQRQGEWSRVSKGARKSQRRRGQDQVSWPGSRAECCSFACVTQEGGVKLEFIDLSFHFKRIPWLLYRDETVGCGG